MPLIHTESLDRLLGLLDSRAADPGVMLAVQSWLKKQPSTVLTTREREIVGEVLRTVAIEVRHGIEDGQFVSEHERAASVWNARARQEDGRFVGPVLVKAG